MSKENAQNEVTFPAKVVDPVIEVDGQEFTVHYGFFELEKLSDRGYYTKPMSERSPFSDSIELFFIGVEKKHGVKEAFVRNLLRTAFENRTVKINGEKASVSEVFNTLITYFSEKSNELNFI